MCVCELSVYVSMCVSKCEFVCGSEGVCVCVCVRVCFIDLDRVCVCVNLRQ